jgi:Tol biopolymer transport system component
VLLDLTKSMVDILLTDLKTGKIYRAVADVQGQSPTIDLDPSFSPDGKTLYATAVTLTLGLVTKVQSYAVALPAKDPDLAAGNRTLPAGAVTTIPGIELAPVIQDTYAGCGG